MITTLPYAEQTAILQAEQSLDQIALDSIATTCNIVGDVLDGRRLGIIANIGPCSLTDEVETVRQESEVLADAAIATSGLVIVRRLNMWKPRTNPNDWFGEETTNPRGAYQTLAGQATNHANLFVELAREDQADRYAHMLSGAWFGSRNDDLDTKIAIAKAHPDLSLALKNPLHGDIEPTMADIKILQEARGNNG
ncbi:MAG TPA: hypothetical protein VMR45_04005, partial [Patescibacteria group bacterium]|nr:hypothetical protein [Patescibacteria group bacterium]